MKIGFRELWLPVTAGAVGILVGISQRPDAKALPRHSDAPPSEAPAVHVEPAPANPADRALAALRTCRNLRDLARLGPLLETLDNAQFAALLAGLERSGNLEDDSFLAPLVGWWTRREPEAATAWVRPRLRKHMRAEHSLSSPPPALLMAWLAETPERALAELRGFTTLMNCAQLLVHAMYAWPDKSPEGRLKVLYELPPGVAVSSAKISIGLSVTASDSLAGQCAALPRAWPYFRDEERDGLLRAIFDNAMPEPQKALALAAEHGLQSPDTWDVLLSQAAEADLDSAADWLDQADPEFLARHAHALGLSWIFKDPADPAAGLNWAAERGLLTTPPERDAPPPARLGSFQEYSEQLADNVAWKPTFRRLQRSASIWEEAMQKQPDAALAWLAQQPPGPERDALVELAGRDSKAWRTTEILAPKGIRPDGEARRSLELQKRLASIMPLALEMPAEAAGEFGYQFAGTLADSNREQAIEWAKSLPDGPIKEQAELALADTEPPESGPPEKAVPIEGKQGYVRSPSDAKGRLIDVRGLPPGTEVEDPYHPGKTLLLP